LLNELHETQITLYTFSQKRFTAQNKVEGYDNIYIFYFIDT